MAQSTQQKTTPASRLAAPLSVVVDDEYTPVNLLLIFHGYSRHKLSLDRRYIPRLFRRPLPVSLAAVSPADSHTLLSIYFSGPPDAPNRLLCGEGGTGGKRKSNDCVKKFTPSLALRNPTLSTSNGSIRSVRGLPCASVQIKEGAM